MALDGELLGCGRAAAAAAAAAAVGDLATVRWGWLVATAAAAAATVGALVYGTPATCSSYLSVP